jgi:hypothetical protein
MIFLTLYMVVMYPFCCALFDLNHSCKDCTRYAIQELDHGFVWIAQIQRGRKG